MVDSGLMRGEGWVRCCICGELHEHPFERLARDRNGNLWDACQGDCAAEAGIAEARKHRGSMRTTRIRRA